MTRILLIAVILVIAWMWLRQALARVTARMQGTERAPGRAGSGPPAELLACDRCGVHLPADRALAWGEGRYCSERCRDDLDGRAGGGRATG